MTGAAPEGTVPDRTATHGAPVERCRRSAARIRRARDRPDTGDADGRLPLRGVARAALDRLA